ncbi:MAG: ATP-binding cassette domain-containing protein [Magnetococcales bacterium]|nr:ATP-binding cassette domain-containing protein [Magnetococcales bacterium]
MRGIGPTILLASVLINVLSLALPLTLVQVYDRILPNESFSTLGWLVTGVVIALILEATLRVARTYLSGWVGIHFEVRVGGGAFNRLTSTRITEFERDGLGTHLDRLNSVNSLREFYSGSAFQVMLDVPFALLFVIAIAYLAGWVAIVPLVSIIAFLGLVYMAKKRFRKALDDRHLAHDRRQNFLIEALSGIHTIKSMGMEELMSRRYERLQETTAETNLSVALWSMSPMVLGAFFSMLVMFGVVALGALSVIDGSLTIGGLSGVTLLAGRALQPVQSAAGFLLRFSDVQLARERLAELVAMPPPPDAKVELPEHDQIRGEMVLNNVSFRYSPKTPLILDEVNLSIKPGETVGIKGDSASGKSTLLYVMMGSLAPTGGSVTLDGFDLQECDNSRLGDTIAYLPQVGVLFQGTILENLTMFRDQRREAALKAAGLLGLDYVVARMPMGFDTMVGKESQDFLSGGVKQRISIARALVPDPPVLLFDEANVAMDAQGDTLLKKVLQQLKGHCTIVLVSHRPSLLELADRILILKGGKLVDAPPPPPRPSGPPVAPSGPGSTANAANPAQPAGGVAPATPVAGGGRVPTLPSAPRPMTSLAGQASPTPGGAALSPPGVATAATSAPLARTPAPSVAPDVAVRTPAPSVAPDVPRTTPAPLQLAVPDRVVNAATSAPPLPTTRAASQPASTTAPASSLLPPQSTQPASTPTAAESGGEGVALARVAVAKMAVDRRTGRRVVMETEAEALLALLDAERDQQASGGGV